MKKDRAIDAMLVTQYRKGDQGSITELVKRWHRLFCEKAYWLVNDADVAKDIAQDSWKTIIDKLEGLKDPASFGAWAMRIVYTKSLNNIKSTNRKRNSLEEYGLQREMLVTEDENDETNEIKKNLLKAIMSLPEHQQMVIRLFYNEEYSLKEISNIMNISVGTAKSRLFHAREKLKTILKQRNYEK